jgi:hypothetical protein
VSDTYKPVHTGGCQCGAVRYALYAEPTNPHVCHCSEAAERGFCRDCGTPLFFRYVDKDRISVSLGSLDEPSRVAPANQYGVEGRLPFVATLTELPGSRTEDDVPEAERVRFKSRQHPDRPD